MKDKRKYPISFGFTGIEANPNIEVGDRVDHKYAHNISGLRVHKLHGDGYCSVTFMGVLKTAWTGCLKLA